MRLEDEIGLDEYLKKIKIGEKNRIEIQKNMKNQIKVMELHKIVTYFISKGFNARQIRLLLVENQKIMISDLEEIKKVIAIFCFSPYRFKMIDIMEKYPDILTMSPKEIQEQIQYLEREINNNRMLEEVINNVPEVLIYGLKNLKTKIENLQKSGLIEFLPDIFIEDLEMVEENRIEELKRKYLN